MKLGFMKDGKPQIRYQANFLQRCGFLKDVDTHQVSNTEYFCVTISGSRQHLLSSFVADTFKQKRAGCR